MKKLFRILLLACLILLLGTSAVLAQDAPLLIQPAPSASDISLEQKPAFVTISIPYERPDDLGWPDSEHLFLRYVDDQSIIPLSADYDGRFWATIPAQYAEREVEAFIAQELEFTDYDPYYFEFYSMNELAVTGIVRGNEKGEALPFENISRAEAVTMLVRMLGLENASAAAANFGDVPADAWYAKNVAIAAAYGIIKGDGTNFFPLREVSREEFVTMTARALWQTGLFIEPENAAANDIDQICNIKDGADVADWAGSAYLSMKTDIITTYVESSEPHPEGGFISYAYAYPQQAANRYECANMLRWLIPQAQIYPSQLAIKYGFDQAMPSIDGSTSSYPFTDAVYRNLFYAGYNHPDRPAAHSKSHTSYERLINGDVDMLFAATSPTQDLLDMAKEKGVELEFIPIAHDAMIFFTNAANPATALTSEQISNIYVKNAYKNWSELGGDDALLYPYCRNNDSGSHAHMERFFLNGNQIHPDIQKETTSISMANVLTDVMNAQTSDPPGYGLGYSIYYYFHNMDLFYDTSTQLKLLAIDGVYPTDATIADGTYPLANNTYIVLRADTPADAPARQMVKFMLSEAGQACVEEAGYGKLNAN